MRYRDEPYKDDLELDVIDEGVEDPDAPLPLPPPTTSSYDRTRSEDMEHAAKWQPRWMRGLHSGATANGGTSLSASSSLSRLRALAHELLLLLRPRLSWRYLLVASLSGYVLYCVLRRSPLLASRLPPYTGPHAVGTVDVEVAVERPRLVRDTLLVEGGAPAYRLDTVLFSVYYPAVKGARSRARHPWLPRPIWLRADGYARAIHMNNWLGRPIVSFVLWAIVGGVDIPAEVDVPLLGADGAEENSRFPVMVFSHGSFSSRVEYTAYCGELASRGFVVAAIEHRDGSGPGTQVLSRNGKARTVHLVGKSDVQTDPPGDDARLKREQLAFREAEIEEAIRVLQSVGAGNGSDVHAANLRTGGRTLLGWTDRLDLDHLVVGGHSYGATGALQALKGAPHSATIPAVGGVILDPGKSSGPLQERLDVPVLVLHSASWSARRTIFYNGRPHFDTVRALAADALRRAGASWFATSLRTSHPSVTDFPLIEPLLMRWTTGATVDARAGVRQYVHATEHFFAFLVSGQRRGVLALPASYSAYGEDARSEEEREARTPEQLKWEKYWQVHVAPPVTEDKQ